MLRRFTLQLSIWTSFYFDLTPADALLRFANLGLKNLELSAEHGEAATRGDDWRIQLAYLRDLCDKNGIKLWQMHAPLNLDVADTDPDKRGRDIDTAIKWIEYSHELNIPHLVIHPGGNNGAKSEEEESSIFDLNLSAFQYLSEAADNFNVMLCIENMQEKNKEPRRLGAYIYDLNDLIDAVGADSLGICFDSSHANVTGLDLYHAIRECGKRLTATHISDNDGSGDQHRMPFNGNIDWSKVMSALKDIDYNCAFNLEIPGESKSQKSSMLPIEVRDAKVTYAKRLFEYMTCSS